MSTVSDALNTLWNKVEQDDLKIILPIGDTYLSALIEGQGDIVKAAQASKTLLDGLQAAGLTLASTDIVDVATALKALMDQEAATLGTAPVVSAPVT